MLTISDKNKVDDLLGFMEKVNRTQENGPKDTAVSNGAEQELQALLNRMSNREDKGRGTSGKEVPPVQLSRYDEEHRNQLDVSSRSKLLDDLGFEEREIPSNIEEPRSRPSGKEDIQPATLKKRPADRFNELVESNTNPDGHNGIKRVRRRHENDASDFMDEIENDLTEEEHETDSLGKDDSDEGVQNRVVIVVGIVITICVLVCLFMFIKGRGKGDNGGGGAAIDANMVPATQTVIQTTTPPQPTVVSVDRGILLSNTQINYADTVFTDTCVINKFIELRGGVALFKFRGTPEHFGKEIEFIVTAEDYNKYVNGVSLVIQYRVVNIQEVDYVIDVQLGQQT